MFVIAGVTGNTGSIVANTLLDAGKPVRVLARDPKKAEALRARGAEVVGVALQDTEGLTRALEGAQGAYLLSPPNLVSTSFLAERRQLLSGVASAVKAARVPHTVFLSSIGAQHPTGTGVIQSVAHGEQVLKGTGLPVTFVRAGYFVENWAGVLPAARQDGVLPSFLPEHWSLAQVSTHDIGRTAAAALLEGPRGTRILELSGPEDVSPGEVAQALTRLLGRNVKVLEAPLAAVVPTFTSFGMSEDIASLYRGLYQGVLDGTVAWQGPPAEAVRGKQGLEETLKGLLGPSA